MITVGMILAPYKIIEPRILLPYVSRKMSRANAYGSADKSSIPWTRPINYHSCVSLFANVYARCEVRENERFCIEGNEFYSVTP